MGVNLSLARPRAEQSSVDMIVRLLGVRYKRSTGLSVATEFWNPRTNLCRENQTHYPDGVALNKNLRRQVELAEQVYRHYVALNIAPSAAEFWGKCDALQRGGTIDSLAKNNISFCDYFEEYINVRRSTLVSSSIRTYKALLSQLRSMEAKRKRQLHFEDIDTDFYRQVQKHMYDNGYSNNYFGRIIKMIRIVYNDAKRAGVHDLPDLYGWKIEDHTADTIYLTPEELHRLAAVEMDTEMERIALSKFILGANTGLRISDFNRLADMNIDNNIIRITTKKTGAKVVIPLNYQAREIIQSGIDISRKLSDQYINRTIKGAAKKAGIDQPVEITKYVAGHRVTEVCPKYELIKSHTARRSFATNAYLAHVPTISIMKITGHTTEKSFLKYIKISNEENAKFIAEHIFFK